MPLILPFDASTLDPKLADALEQIVTSLQSWAGDSVDTLGKWIPIPYDPANFTSDMGSWAVNPQNVIGMNYSVVQNLMFFQIDLNNTTTAGAPTELWVKIPAGYRSILNTADYVGSAGWNGGLGVNCTGMVYVRNPPNGDTLKVLRDTGPTAWPNLTNLFDLSFMVVIPVFKDARLL